MTIYNNIIYLGIMCLLLITKKSTTTKYKILHLRYSWRVMRVYDISDVTHIVSILVTIMI